MSNNILRIGFMGTPDFSVPALQALHQSKHDVVCVYSQPPRPKGRGHQIQPSPVHAYANEHNIPVLTPKNLKSKTDQEQFAQHNLDIAVVVAYGLILPTPVLKAPQYGCINIHASLLPRWRGASPIQQSIQADDKETGISIMYMEEGLDTGPVIRAQSIPITNKTTAGSLHDSLSDLGAKMIVKIIDEISAKGDLTSTPQDENLVTYAPLLKKEDGQIDWDKPAHAIDCQIRALTPWPSVFTYINDKRIKVLEAEKIGHEHYEEPGTILDREGRIACGNKTTIKLKRIQPLNTKPMSFDSAINGNHLKINDIFTFSDKK